MLSRKSRTFPKVTMLTSVIHILSYKFYNIIFMETPNALLLTTIFRRFSDMKYFQFPNPSSETLTVLKEMH